MPGASTPTFTLLLDNSSTVRTMLSPILIAFWFATVSINTVIPLWVTNPSTTSIKNTNVFKEGKNLLSEDAKFVENLPPAGTQDREPATNAIHPWSSGLTIEVDELIV